MCSMWEHQYHSQRGENWFWEGSNLKLNPKNKKVYSLFSLVMENLKKNLEWGGVNEKNRKAGLKASGERASDAQRSWTLYILKKRQRGNKSMNVIKVRSFLYPVISNI